MLGAKINRREDQRMVRGKGTFASDINLPNLAHAAMLRSPHAHARIVHIDTSAARSAPGVLAVVTFDDIADIAKPIPQLMPHPTLQSRMPYALARGLVRYVGEPVAMVVAEHPYLAEDAVELIRVEYQPLDPVVDPEAGLAESAPRVHDDLSNNVAGQFGQALGDVQGELARSHLVLTDRLTIGRVSAQPLETRAISALYQPDQPTEALTVWWSTQGPHNARRVLAEQLALPLHQVRVIAPDIGGGFGVKNRQYPEDMLVPLMAMRLGRPVKWVEDRRESFIATYHAREQIHQVTLGLAEDGTILALRDRFIYDQGAYTPLGVVVPFVTSVSVPGPYRVPNYEVDCTMVFTNKTPTAPYRGAGKPQANFVMERMMDLGAKALNMDPVEIRRRNLLSPKDFPYTTGLIDLDETPVVYDSGNYPACLERVLKLIGYPQFPEQQARARKLGRHIGIGVACYIEMTGRGPFEGARVRVEPSGRVVVYSGVSAQGQSHETTLAQVCAQYLGLRLEDVSVVIGDTAVIPQGIGTYAARVAVMAGNAVAMAALAVREKAIIGAARLLDVSARDLEWADGRIHMRREPSRSVALGDVAQYLRDSSRKTPLPQNSEAELEATHYFNSSRPAYANGTYAVVVEVDPETGAVKVLRHAIVHDCGVMINPLVVEGQIHGGVAQGLGGALLEEVRYDKAGQLLTGSYMDYHLPTATEVPSLLFEHMETPSPFNPLGVKGVGEAGTIPAAAAVNAAIENALDRTVRLRRTPVHPPDVLALINAWENR